MKKKILSLAVCLVLSVFCAINACAMLIFVKYSTDETITLDVENTDTVWNVKGKIQDRKEIPANLQSLTFNGKKLENEKTMQDYNIQKESILYLSQKTSLELTPANPSGDTTAKVTSQTIATPTYTVTIPTEIDFGTVKKTVKQTYAYTSKNTVTVKHTNLYENEKVVNVTVDEAAGTLKSGNDTLAYEFVTKAGEADTKLDLSKPVITAAATEQDTDVSESFDFYGKTDCSKIKVAGTFSQTVKFTVTMTEKEAEE